MRERLSLGFSSFTALRESNAIYVDKTVAISELATRHRQVLFTRPRRFGKTLLLSTLETLFRSGLAAFKGLSIASQWNDRTYDVVRLDFSEIKEFSDLEAFERKLLGHLYAAFNPYGFDATALTQRAFYGHLSAWLAARPVSSLVLLIDEYDAPMTRWLDDASKCEGACAILRAFFDILARHEQCFRFLYVTGITRWSTSSSPLATLNITDVTADPTFSAIVGFTLEEINHYYSDFVKVAANLNKVTPDQLLVDLTHFYGGYDFCGCGRKALIGPWSLLNLFNDHSSEFSNYWYQSGDEPSVLVEHLHSHSRSHAFDFGELQTIPERDLLLDTSDGSVNLYALLQQTGYLAIKAVYKNGLVTLGFPNQEIAVSVAQLTLDVLAPGARISAPGTPTNRDLLLMSDFDEWLSRLNRFLQVQTESSDQPPTFLLVDAASSLSFLRFWILLSAMTPPIRVHGGDHQTALRVKIGSTECLLEIKSGQSLSSHSPQLDSNWPAPLEATLKSDEQEVKSHRICFIYDVAKHKFAKVPCEPYCIEDCELDLN